MQNTTNGRHFRRFARFVGTHPGWFAGFAAAGVLLRFSFVFHFCMVTPDSLVYGDLAKNWITQHVYGISTADGLLPVDIRLPGYPAYLAVTFLIAGIEHYRAACIGQVFIDLGTCFLISWLALRIAGERAARWAFALTALCPFFANYTSTALTETWAIFLTTAALLFATFGTEELEIPSRQNHLRGATQKPWAWCGVMIGLATLLRPDSGMLLIALGLWLGWRLLRDQQKGRVVLAGMLVGVFTFVPLVPWVLRNAITLHEFQPLAPVTATEPGEFFPAGFNRWLRTWEMDYASQEDIGFNVSGEPIPFNRLPNRAFDDVSQRQRTEELFREYNQTLVMTPQLDAQFAELARERIAGSPWRYYVELPVVRAIDMWLRPRTAMLPVSIHWWTFNDPRDSAIAIALGVYNLLLLGAAAWAWWRLRPLPFMGMMMTFVVVRTVILVAISLPEPRYALECYPIVLALAGAAANRHPATISERTAGLTS